MAKRGTADPGREQHPERLEPVTVSIAEAAQIIGIGTSTAYRLVDSGEFPVPVQRFGGVRRVLKSDLRRWADGTYIQAAG